MVYKFAHLASYGPQTRSMPKSCLKIRNLYFYIMFNWKFRMESVVDNDIDILVHEIFQLNRITQIYFENDFNVEKMVTRNS